MTTELAWPAAVQTVPVQFGDAGDPNGVGQAVTVAFEAVADGVTLFRWADGFTLFPQGTTLIAAPGVVRTVPMPCVDQPGWVDQNGTPVTNWKIRAALEYGSGENPVTTVAEFQPSTHMTGIIVLSQVRTDVVNPVFAPQPLVLDVNGMTGHVIIPAGGGGSGSAPISYSMAQSAQWSLPITLDHTPLVQTTVNGEVVDADVVVTPDLVTVTWPEPTAGVLTLS